MGRTRTEEWYRYGTYKLKVFDYEFFVKVDNTVPSTKIVLGDLYFNNGLSTVDLSGHAFDQHIKNWAIEYGEGDNPQEWYELSRGDDNLIEKDEEGNPILNPIGDVTIKSFIGADVEFLVGKKIRITSRGSRRKQGNCHHKFPRGDIRCK